MRGRLWYFYSFQKADSSYMSKRPGFVAFWRLSEMLTSVRELLRYWPVGQWQILCCASDKSCVVPVTNPVLCQWQILLARMDWDGFPKFLCSQLFRDRGGLCQARNYSWQLQGLSFGDFLPGKLSITTSLEDWKMKIPTPTPKLISSKEPIGVKHWQAINQVIKV